MPGGLPVGLPGVLPGGMPGVLPGGLQAGQRIAIAPGQLPPGVMLTP